MKLRINFETKKVEWLDIDASDTDADLICAYMLEQNPSWEMLVEAREAVLRSKVLHRDIVMDDTDVLSVLPLPSNY